MSQDLICLSSSDEDDSRGEKRKLTAETETKNVSKKPSKENASDSNESVTISLVSDDEEPHNPSISDKENMGNNTNALSEINKENSEKNDLHHCKTEALQCNTSNDTEKENNGDAEFNEPLEVGAENSNDVGIDPKLDESFSKIQDSMGDLIEEAASFLITCKKQLNTAQHSIIIDKKFPSIIKMFKKMPPELAQSEYLKVFLKKQTTIAAESVTSCLISFRVVYEQLKEISDCEGIELPKEQSKQLRKLEKAMKQVLARIKELEEEEVDFENADDDEDSSYIKLDRYTRHLNKLHKKYCQILKKNPYSGRITFERIDFMSSKYNEINLAICKTYKNNKTFPSYEEIYNLIRKVVEEKKLSLNDAQVKSESSHCFKALGELLQQRRQKELYESHCNYIIQEDPALLDKDLDAKLHNHSKTARAKMDEVYQEFVRKQELGGDDEEVDCCSEKNDDSDDVNCE